MRQDQKQGGGPGSQVRAAKSEADAWRNVCLNFLLDTLEEAHAQTPQHPRAKLVRGVKQLLFNEPSAPSVTPSVRAEAVSLLSKNGISSNGKRMGRPPRALAGSIAAIMDSDDGEEGDGED